MNLVVGVSKFYSKKKGSPKGALRGEILVFKEVSRRIFTLVIIIRVHLSS
jgi:hypothetical protein